MFAISFERDGNLKLTDFYTLFLHLMDHRFMRYIQILIGTLFCLLVQQDIYAQTLYTWKDASGTIHITRKKPPASQPLTDQLRYTARLSPKTQTQEPSPNDMGNDAVIAAIRQAKQARKLAQESRHMAENAIKKANQTKNETEAFLEPWRGKKRIRKTMQLEIESRIEKANLMIASAEQLIDSANEAEKKAQAAEKKAKKTQDQFFEVYKEVTSN